VTHWQQVQLLPFDKARFVLIAHLYSTGQVLRDADYSSTCTRIGSHWGPGVCANTTLSFIKSMFSTSSTPDFDNANRVEGKPL
jgi:hypothetical protein